MIITGTQVNYERVGGQLYAFVWEAHVDDGKKTVLKRYLTEEELKEVSENHK